MGSETSKTLLVLLCFCDEEECAVTERNVYGGRLDFGVCHQREESSPKLESSTEAWLYIYSQEKTAGNVKSSTHTHTHTHAHTHTHLGSTTGLALVTQTSLFFYEGARAEGEGKRVW